MIDSQQSILEHSDIRSMYPFQSEYVIDDFLSMKRDLLALVQMLNNGEFSTLSGVGSPEGVVTSNVSKVYFDTAAQKFYFNDIIGINTGWVIGL